MATLQNLGVLKYRDKDGNWKPLPVVLQSSGGGGSGGISTISGKGQPTESTVGRLNQLYRDEDTQRLYICTAVDGGYTWAAVSGGSVDVDATLTKAGYAADAKAAGDAIGRKIDAPQTAAVGEVLTVEEVGEDGKPTKWKAQTVDMPKEIEWVNATWTFSDNVDVTISTDISATEVIRRIKEGRCCVVRLTNEFFKLTMLQSYCGDSTANFITIFNNIIYILNFSTMDNGSDIVRLNTSSIGSMLFDLDRNPDDPTKATLMYGITLSDINTAMGSDKTVCLRIGENVYSWSESGTHPKFSTIIEDGNELKYSRITLGGDGNPHSTNATIYEKVL